MPSLSRINSPGRGPKRKISPEFGCSAPTLAGYHLVSAEIGHRRRNEIAHHGIEERCKRGQKAAAKKDCNGAAALGLGLS